MPNTPLLGITQVSASQSSKEVTINDAILALENATNRKKDINFSGLTDYVLTATEATRNFIFAAVTATANATLTFPVAVNGTPFERIFVVRNVSGYGITVRFAGDPGTSVTIPDGQSRLISGYGGVDMIVAAEPQASVNFLTLDDTPDSYTGNNGKFLTAKMDGTGLEFVDAAVFPTLTDNETKILAVKADGTGVEWIDIGAITDLTGLDDTPASYAGAGAKLLAVKSDETGIEFIDPPEAEAVEFVSAARWRVRAVAPGTEAQVGFGEVAFLNRDGFAFPLNGVATAASFDEGKEPEFAFDGNVAVGAGWLSDPEYLDENWIEYAYDAPVEVRHVRLSPLTGFPSYTPTRVAFDYWNGAEWIEAGDRLTSEWIEATAQTFKVAGFPLQSVPDAPSDGTQYVRRNGAWEAVVATDPFPDLTDNAGKVLAVNDTEDGAEWIDPPSSGAAAPYSIPFAFTSAPLANEILLLHVFAEAITLPDDFAGAVGKCGTNPAGDLTLTVKKNDVAVGTIVISTTGAFTFATTGTTVAFAIGDLLTVQAPASPNANIANTAFTFKGIRE